MNIETIERKDLSEVLGKTVQKSNPSFLLVQVFLCILIAGFTVYAYIDKHNELTELRLAIPALAKEVKQIQEENIRLMYDINQFESPIHLMQLARKPEFGHLKYPYYENEIILLEGKITDDVQR